METKRGSDTLPFELAIRDEAARCATAAPLQHRVWSSADRGYYSVQIDRIARWFPATQMLILKSEDLQREPASTLARIVAFLGVDPFPQTLPRDVFHLPYEQPMSATAHALLSSAFAAEFDRLEHLLGWDLSEWRAPPPIVEKS
jgi:hypothetical protein